MKNIWWILGIAGIFWSQVYAQTALEKLLPEFEVQDMLQNVGELVRLAPTVSDGVVDPTRYFVGPGDILLVQVTGVLSVAATQMVAPDGSLALPRVGMVMVGGKTLAAVRAAIRSAYERYNPELQVAVSLLKPRQVVVSVQGNVLAPGSYTVPANLRVSTVVHLIQMAAQQERQKQRLSTSEQMLAVRQRWQQRQLQQQGAIVRVVPYIDRHLLLLRSTDVYDVDPLRSAIDTAIKEPLVQEKDQLIVPFPPRDYPQISIAGDVPLPTILPYRPGDHLAFALQVAGVDSLPAGTRIIVRNQEAQREYQWQGKLSWKAFRAIPLSAGTAVIVQQPGSAAQSRQMVAVVGAVEFPGVYPIISGTTRLSAVLKMVGTIDGGDQALQQGYILRRSAVEPYDPAELYEFVRLLRAFPVDYFDTTHYRIDLLARRQMILTDFAEAMTHPGSTADVLLEAGDLIVIPEQMPMVYVFGQVRFAGYVPYQPGKSVEWYLARAGGLTPVAEEGEIQVWKRGRGGWVNAEEAVIEPGDQIYVPRERVLTTAERMQIFGVILGLASSAAFMISTLVNLLSR